MLRFELIILITFCAIFIRFCHGDRIFLCTARPRWSEFPVACHSDIFMDDESTKTENRLKIQGKRLKAAENEIREIRNENEDLKKRLAFLESTVSSLTNKETLMPAKNCDVQIEDLCFTTFVEKKWNLTYERAVAKCKEFNSVVTEITDETQYKNITDNLREKIPDGWSLIYIWIANEITPQTGKLTVPYTHWLRGLPKVGDEHSKWKNIYLIVDRNPEVKFQGMGNIPSGTLWNGVVCQTRINT